MYNFLSFISGLISPLSSCGTATTAASTHLVSSSNGAAASAAAAAAATDAPDSSFVVTSSNGSSSVLNGCTSLTPGGIRFSNHTLDKATKAKVTLENYYTNLITQHKERKHR